MWTRDAVTERLSRRGVDVLVWGSQGPHALSAVEDRLGFVLPPDVRQFALGVGNVGIAPINLVVTGNVLETEGSVISCVTQTERMRVRNPKAPPYLVSLVEHAGLVYCVSSRDGTAASYDHFYVEEGAEIERWAGFEQLFDYLVEEAVRIG